MTRSLRILRMALVSLVILHLPAVASAVPEAVCDEPSAAACPDPEAPPPQVVFATAPVQPRWRPRLSLSVVSGVGAHAFLLGSSSGPTPFMGGELRVIWHKRASVVGLGFRLGASSTIDGEGSGDTSRGELRVLGFDAGFVFSASWFWLSSGIGAMHVQDLRPDRSSTTVPDVSLALGLDIPLGDHFALRLYGQAATVLVSVRLNAGGGLVVRF